MPCLGLLNLVASRFFQNASHKSGVPFRQFGHGVGGGPWPLTPHKVQRQVEGPSDHGKVNKTIDTESVMGKTFGLEGAIENVYLDESAGDCVDDFVDGLVQLL